MSPLSSKTVIGAREDLDDLRKEGRRARKKAAKHAEKHAAKHAAKKSAGAVLGNVRNLDEAGVIGRSRLVERADEYLNAAIERL